MSPAFHEADYYLALRRARRAWEASQPQFVIPGVLEEVDVARADGKPPIGRLSGVSAAASISSSPSPVPPHTSPGAGSPT